MVDHVARGTYGRSLKWLIHFLNNIRYEQLIVILNQDHVQFVFIYTLYFMLPGHILMVSLGFTTADRSPRSYHSTRAFLNSLRLSSPFLAELGVD